MEMRSLLHYAIAISCLAATLSAAVPESKASSHSATQTNFQEEAEASIHMSEALASAAPQKATGESRPISYFGNSSLPNSLIRKSTFRPKSDLEIVKMWKMVLLYKGPSKAGLSRKGLRNRFLRNLRPKLREHLSRSVGGMIFEFGDKKNSPRKTCSKRPSLTLTQVQNIARASFGVRNYKLTYPPCNDGGKVVACNYDGGTCCQRPQVEFIGRYYDTAVAAMALGATLEEAFAPMMHARILAYALESCDPLLSFRSYPYNNSRNDFGIEVRHASSNGETVWRVAGASLISFPKAYEVLYELYNTMLIERIRSRSRGKPRFPSHAQMQALNEALYYKKMMASAAFVDLELNPCMIYPTSEHFSAAGLVMATSSRIAQMSRMETPDAAEVRPSRDLELHPLLRSSSNQFVTIYETRTRRWERMYGYQCNMNLRENDYYPHKFQVRVYSKYEGCCAKECKFMALYGKTFGVESSNCCAGCNRYRCSANNFQVANYLARLSTIETAPKLNSGSEEFTFAV